MPDKETVALNAKINTMGLKVKTLIAEFTAQQDKLIALANEIIRLGEERDGYIEELYEHAGLLVVDLAGEATR